MSSNASVSIDTLPTTTNAKPTSRQAWSSHFAFVMAAVGSAVGWAISGSSHIWPGPAEAVPSCWSIWPALP
jgi:hypothetical protein